MLQSLQLQVQDSEQLELVLEQVQLLDADLCLEQDEDTIQIRFGGRM